MKTQTITSVSDLLSGVRADRVLDIATGRGGFACLLEEQLADFQIIAGIDLHRHVLLEAYAQCLGPKVHFLEMEISHLGFEANSFDLACASACLHHLTNVPDALQEAMRVLRPGGSFLLVEMHSDARDEAQRTGILLHQWAADVDAAGGISHRHTYSRQDLLSHITRLGLQDVEIFDLRHEPQDPHDPKTIERLSDFIDDHLQHARGSDQYGDLLQRWSDLHTRLEDTGVRREPVVAIRGSKI